MIRRDFLLELTAFGVGLSTHTWSTQPNDQWPLFSVEANGNRAYLTGETPPRPVRWHDSRIEALVPRCSAVWTETNNTYRQSIQDLIARYGIDDAHPLESRLTAQDQERLSKVADLVHVPLTDLAKYRPWVAGSLLEDEYYKVMHMSDAAQTVLVGEANAAHVSVSSEFSVKDDVIEWFGAMSPEQDVQFLRYSLDMILAGEAENDRIFTAWSKRDAGPADARVAGFGRDYPDLYPKILVARNKGWIPRFNTMLANKTPALVITGLYHLAGPDSLLMQLRAAGLTVRAI